MLTALLMVASSSGCYRYVPMEVGTAPPGTEVRMLVTRAGAQEADMAGALNGLEPTLEGTIVAQEGDDLLVRVPVAVRADGFIESKLEQSVRVPMGEIVSFQRRELNTGATALLLTSVAAGGAALFAFIVKPLAGQGNDGEPPPDEFFDIVSFSLPFTLGR